MIKAIYRILLVLGPILLNNTSIHAQTATYLLDVKQSKLFWKGTKTVGSKHYGYLLFNSGWLRTNIAGKLNDGLFSIDMKSIKSTEHKDDDKNKGVEKELNGKSFFETSTYPTATISVNSIVPTPKASEFRVVGDLTIKKTTKTITFLATIKQNGLMLTANAKLTIDRKKWGIHQQNPETISDQLFGGLKDKMIADEIPVVLNLVFKKK